VTKSARIGLAGALVLGGATLATAQNGSPSRWYPPGVNPYGYDGYSSYYARPRYAPSYPYYCRTPYYVLGYPVPHYGYKGWCFWR